MSDHCFFCDRPVLGSGVVCDAQECRGSDERYREEMDRCDRINRLKAVKYAIIQHCKHSDEIRFGMYEYPLRLQFNRWFYAFKAIISIWLELSEGLSGQIKIPHIDGIACWDFGPAGGEYSGQSWMELTVGQGVFSNWSYEIFSNSSV